MNLNQITVPTINIEKAIQFYEMLGLKLIVKSIPKYARFECPDGSSTFSIHQVNELPNGDGVYAYFEYENLDSKVMELKAKGIQFEHEPIDQSWLWREARLKDLDNNQLILFYAGKNRVDPPWKI
jgi:catechol 2,3-dioxygenase-like lactoylglutathione lyase family enzyme